MAAYTPASSRLPSFLPDSSSVKSSRPVGSDYSLHGTAMDSDGRVGFLNSEKGMILESHRNGGEAFMSGQTASTEGILHVTIHHANDIHNICIYGNQDVYAKFSITHCQDAVYPTQPVKAGGQNPVFNQSLQIPVSQPEAVLKCEIWMMSCARNYLEDQLLGFVLVSLGSLFGKEKRTQDYALTSTDLFHTPAGTVCLSLLFHSRSRGLLDHELNGKMYEDSNLAVFPSPRSPEVMMDCGNQSLAPADLNKIEFPDLEAASENQQLVSDYLKMASGDLRNYSGPNGIHHEDAIAAVHQDLTGAPFLQLGSPMAEMDCEMSSCTGEDKCMEGTPFLRDGQLFNLTSPSSGVSLSGVEAPSSTKNTVPSSVAEQKSGADLAPSSNSPNGLVSSDNSLFKSAQTATSSASLSSSVEGCGQSPPEMSENEDKGKDSSTSHESVVTASTTPLVSVSVEPEVTVVQQQIVEMYNKSMQQFTESLAKMKLPLDMETQGSTEPRNTRTEQKGTEEGKKEGHKVFYGSRAFF